MIFLKHTQTLRSSRSTLNGRWRTAVDALGLLRLGAGITLAVAGRRANPWLGIDAAATPVHLLLAPRDVAIGMGTLVDRRSQATPRWLKLALAADAADAVVAIVGVQRTRGWRPLVTTMTAVAGVATSAALLRQRRR